MPLKPPQKKQFFVKLAELLNEYIDESINYYKCFLLIPWKSQTVLHGDEAITSFSGTDITQLNTYVHNFNVRSQRGGMYYYRVQASFSEEANIDDYIAHMTGCWGVNANNMVNTIRRSPSPAINPIIIGFLLRSLREHINTMDLANVLINLSGCASLGLSWGRIRDAVWRKDAKNPFAIIIECDKAHQSELCDFLDTLYGPDKTKDCPLDINMSFVRSDGDDSIGNSAGASSAYEKCKDYQEVYKEIIQVKEVDYIIGLNKSVCDIDPSITLRRWLMTLRVKTILGRKGNRVFLSCDRCVNQEGKDRGYAFSFSKLDKDEALQTLANLPLILLFVLGQNPYRNLTANKIKARNNWYWCTATWTGRSPAAEQMRGIVADNSDLEAILTAKNSLKTTKVASSFDPMALAALRRANGDDDETLNTVTRAHVDNGDNAGAAITSNPLTPLVRGLATPMDFSPPTGNINLNGAQDDESTLTGNTSPSKVATALAAANAQWAEKQSLQQAQFQNTVAAQRARIEQQEAAFSQQNKELDSANAKINEQAKTVADLTGTLSSLQDLVLGLQAQMRANSAPSSSSNAGGTSK